MSDCSKPKVAFYWCSSCGGCEETVVDLHEDLLDVAATVDIVFWPAAMDFKVTDVEAFADDELAVSFVNGAIRTDEQLHMAKLLRRKSKLLIAFGSCAHLGGIPGLANLTSRREIFRTSYLDSPKNDNPQQTTPQTQTTVDGREVTLPAFWEQVHTLAQVVDVDYTVPGCPPPSSLLAEAIERILNNKLPEKGAVLAPDKALCDSCPRRETKTPGLRLKQLHRPHEIVADPEICFLDQGIICCGPATRSGCGEKCILGNMPCTGCFGPPPGVLDQGAKLLGAIATLFDADTPEAAEAMARQVVDPAGTFARYSVPASLLAMKVEGDQGGES